MTGKFSDRLQHLMDLKKKNQREVSEGAGVYQSRVSAWLRGATEAPRRDTLQKLSGFFGCNIDWLETGEGSMFTDNVQNERQIITNSTVAMGGGVAQTTKQGKNVHQSVMVAERDALQLTTEEEMVIKLIRKKDTDGELALKIIEQLLQMR